MKLPFGFNLTRKQSPSEGAAARTSVNVYQNVGGWWPEDVIERNPALRLPRRFTTYRRFIRSIPIIAAFSELYAGLVAQTTFGFDGDDDRAQEMLGALLESQQLRWLSEGLLYGFCVLEWQCNPDWSIKAAWRLPPQTVIDAEIVDNEVVNFSQWLETGERFELPAWKSCYVLRGNPPYGEGILMKVADQALRFLQNAALVAGASEVNLKNIPDWSVPKSAGDNDDTVKEIRKVHKTSTGAFFTPVVPPSNLQYAEDALGGQRYVSVAEYNRVYPPRADIEKNDLREKYERQIARVLGMEAFMLGESSVGSFALADVQSGAFVNLVRGGVGLVRDALQEVLDFQYMMRGFGEAPTITADWTAWTTSESLAAVLSELSKAGVMFTADSEAVHEVLERAGLSVDGLEDEEENKPDSNDSGNQGGGNQG